MINIQLLNDTKTPSSDRAIAFAKALMESKRQSQQEFEKFKKTAKYQELRQKLDDLNKPANAKL